MTKEEVLKYVTENGMLPEGPFEYGDDLEFCMQILQQVDYVIDDFPDETKKKVLLTDNSYLDAMTKFDIFQDEEFAKQLIEKDIDVLIKLKGLRINSEYIKNLESAFIKGEQVPLEGSKLAKYDKRRLYLESIREVQYDLDVEEYMLSQDIYYFRLMNDERIKSNPKYIYEYVKKSPYAFGEYFEQLSSMMTPELLAIVLRDKFENYKFFDRENPLMKQFYRSFDRIREIRPELTLDNPNLRYDLLCNPEFVDMDVNILNSLLEYNTGNVDKIIDVKDRGRLSYLLKYIEQYNGIYGNNLENIQNAIGSFENIEGLLVDTNNFEGLEVDEAKLKTIIATKNKFGIASREDLLHYDEKVRDFYKKKLEQARTPEEIREVYSEMLFNASCEDCEKFNEEFCNFNVEELREYAERKGLESPVSEEFLRRVDLYRGLSGIEDAQELQGIFDQMPLEVCDLDEAKQQISNMYSQSYDSELLDLNDESLEHEDYEGVDVIKLNGQSFNLCIHRIFNFDFSMNSVATEIVNNPEQWSLTEGSSTISTTLITDKKIAALFRPMKDSDNTPVYIFDSKEESDEHTRKAVEEARRIANGEKLTPIDENAVFYGFTDVLEGGIIKMDSTDMMVEHGKGHLATKTSNCRMRSSEDLAYWTKADYWNELVQKRRETNIDKAKELREERGTDRAMPSCIVCFDGKINEESLRAARAHKVPILMIDRQQYLDLNSQRLEAAREDFGRTLSPESASEIFYRQPYDKVVEEMPKLIESVRNNTEVSDADKKMSLEYLAYLGQHFIEQSSGYVIDIPVEELNKRMQECIQGIDQDVERTDLVTMDDMRGAYREVSALDRKKRYEALKADMREYKSRESGLEHDE